VLADALKGVVSQVLCRKVGGGRVAARETLIVTPQIAHLIRDGKTAQIPQIMHNARQAGMQTLNDALVDLVERAQVSRRRPGSGGRPGGTGDGAEGEGAGDPE
jgi:twitching motility protein PilT